jgi:diguanylate cyclase (GGDEF)-like protein
MTKEVKRISLSIFLLPILIALFVIGISYTTVFISLKNYFQKQKLQTQEEFFKDLKIKTKKRVEIAYNILQTLYNKKIKECKKDNIPLNLCKKEFLNEIVDVFDNFRWPNKGYIFILDFYGNTLYHPDHSLMKINRWNLTRNGVKIFQLLVNEAKAHPKGTYVKYLGYNFHHKPIWKVSYVKVFKPLDALVGSGVYLDYLNKRLIELQKDQEKIYNKLLENLYLSALIIIVLTLLVSYFLAKLVQNMFLKYEHQIEKEKTKLQKESITDNLTGLFNRNYLKYIFEVFKSKAKRENKKLAVLFIDLDYFKEINDTLGHKYGDMLLKIISKRFREVLRKEDTIIRFGGDEFVVLMLFKKEEEILNVIERLYKKMQEKIILKNKEFNIGLSIGISIYPDDGEELDILIKNADMAMYEAKKKGKGRFEFFRHELSEKLEEKTELKNDLINAIKNEEFEIYFQPKIYKNENLYGSEVLIRWNHPKRGFLTPNVFLPVAYEKHLITDIDFIVLKKALKQYKKWENKGYKPGKISCNITTIDLENKDFIEKIEGILKENNFNAENLILEVTEENVMKNPEQNIEFLRKLRKLGIGISIDDFGTGYSSLSYLKKLPITELKIDRSFVKDIGIDYDDEEIVRIIILLGKVLNLKVVAEGVETKEQKEFLLLEGVDIIQGYLYSPPIKAEEFEEKFLKV